MNPLLRVLKTLGGSGTIEEINAKVIEAVGLSDEQLEIIHDPERGSQTEVEYRLAWARTPAIFLLIQRAPFLLWIGIIQPSRQRSAI